LPQETARNTREAANGLLSLVRMVHGPRSLLSRYLSLAFTSQTTRKPMSW
jgi:hypothetical protein